MYRFFWECITLYSLYVLCPWKSWESLLYFLDMCPPYFGFKQLWISKILSVSNWTVVFCGHKSTSLNTQEQAGTLSSGNSGRKEEHLAISVQGDQTFPSLPISCGEKAKSFVQTFCIESRNLTNRVGKNGSGQPERHYGRDSL